MRSQLKRVDGTKCSFLMAAQWDGTGPRCRESQHDFGHRRPAQKRNFGASLITSRSYMPAD